MEVKKEPDHKIKKSTISATRFPKTYPTFVVAFSLKETYDDLATAQQMICNKYSPQDSVDSITPTNSVKSIKNVANELSDKLEQVSAAAELQKTKEDKNDIIIVIEDNTVITNQSDIKVFNKEDTEIATGIAIDEISYCNNTEIVCQENRKSNIFPLVDSLKIINNDQIEKFEEILDYSLSTEYPLEEDSRESNAIYMGNSQDGINNNNENLITDLYYDNEKIEMDETPKTDNCKKNEIETVDTEIIFNAFGHFERKETKVPKRKLRKHKTVTKVYFKSNSYSRNTIRSQINGYYNKKKIPILYPKQIKEKICGDPNITITSREEILKNVSAKENLIEEIDLTYVKNTSSNASLVSFLSTTKESCISNASENTLTRKDSEILQKEGDVDTANSVIQIPPEKVYVSDVIIAATAITYNINDKTVSHTVLPKDTFMNLECLTSTETLKALDRDSSLTSNSDRLISTPQQNEVSETLINNDSSFEISSSYERYYNAKTSSEIKKEHDADYPQIYEAAYHQINEKKQKSLLSTVINLGLYPNSPSTSSAGTNENVQDNVIVTNVKKYSYDLQYFDNSIDQNENVLKKPNIIRNKTVIFPNQNEIQALIDDNNMRQQKCAEEARNPTNTFEKLWEIAIPIIDLAVKRIEDTFTDKILGELNKTLARFEIFKKTNIHRDVEMMSGDIAVYNKEVSTREIKTISEQGLQCDLIHNNVLDEMMKKLSVDGPQIITTTSKSFPKIKPQTFGDVVEVLKPPFSPIVVEKGETVTISTLTRGSDFNRFNRLTTMFRPPVNFLRQNVLVLTSVPAFFIVLLCLYGVVLLVMNP